MKNKNKTKVQLANEFEEMRMRMMKLESGEGHHMQAEFCKETLRQSILSLEVDTGAPGIADILDAPMIESLMNSFHEFTHIPLAIVDLRGKVLAGPGWGDICKRFHRVHPDTCRNCIESDILLSAGIPAGEYKLYKCKNNMWDIATPIIVDGKHLGNVISGQFFFDDESVDYELFRLQAKKYGFPEEEYIAALEAVPRFSRKSMDAGMTFLMKLARMISQMSYSNIKLVQSLEERETLMKSVLAAEDKYRGIFENALEGIYRITTSGRFLDANPALAHIFGYDTPEALINAVTPVGELLHVDPQSREQFIAIMDQQDYATYEGKMLKKDGSPFWIHLRGRAVRDAEGKTIHYEGFAEDITEKKKIDEELKHYRDDLEAMVAERTFQLQEKNRQLISEIAERKRVEEALSKSEALYRNLFENIPIGMFQTNFEEGGFISVNPAYAKILGYESPEDLKSSVANVAKIHVDPKDRDTILAALRDRDWYHAEYPRLRKDGSVMIGKVAIRSVLKADGSVDYIEGIVEDVTERRLAEEKLKKYAEEVTDLYENAPCGYHSLAKDGTIIRINNTELTWLGYSREEVVGKMKFTDLIPPDESASFWQTFPLLQKQGRVSNIEGKLTRRDGSILPVLINATTIFDENGNFLMSRSSVFDNTERKKIEDALVENEVLYRNLFENASIGMFQSTLEGQFIRINKAYATMLGYDSPEEVISTITDTSTQIHTDPENRTKLLAALKQEGWCYAEQPYLRKDGTIMIAELAVRKVTGQDGAISYLEGIVEDITKWKKAEEALMKSERELRIKAHNLLEVNTTMKVLLDTMERDQEELKERILTNIKEQVLPWLEKLKKRPLQDVEKDYIQMAESQLAEIASPFIHKLTSSFLNLTKKEIQVASLVREGKTSKEIAELLNSKKRVIDFHRENIRKKLGLNNKKGSLAILLRSFS